MMAKLVGEAGGESRLLVEDDGESSKSAESVEGARRGMLATVNCDMAIDLSRWVWAVH